MTIIIKATSLRQRETAVALVERILINRILARADDVHSFSTSYVLRLSATIAELHELATALDNELIDYE